MAAAPTAAAEVMHGSCHGVSLRQRLGSRQRVSERERDRAAVVWMALAVVLDDNRAPGCGAGLGFGVWLGFLCSRKPCDV